jgi:hypothetical protein
VTGHKCRTTGDYNYTATLVLRGASYCCTTRKYCARVAAAFLQVILHLAAVPPSVSHGSTAQAVWRTALSNHSTGDPLQTTRPAASAAAAVANPALWAGRGRSNEQPQLDPRVDRAARLCAPRALSQLARTMSELMGASVGRPSGCGRHWPGWLTPPPLLLQQSAA